MTLKDIIAANPGISIAEAAQRLNAHNSALAAATATTSISASSSAVTNPALALASGSGVPMNPLLASLLSSVPTPGIGGLIGEGGAVTKPHREL